jgi:surface carbohydrate biosynthesis protein
LYFRNKKIKFISSECCNKDVLVFDAIKTDVTNVVCHDLSFFNLHIRRFFYINKKVFLLSIFLFFKYGTRGYWYALIEVLSPKVIITTIDSNKIYWWLDENLKSKKFLTIQNSTRVFNKGEFNGVIEVGAYTYPDFPYHSNFACFGYVDKDLYVKNEVDIGSYYIVGSPMNSICHKSDTLSKNCNYDVCLISDGHINKYYYICILKNLKKYIDEYRGLRVVIAMKSEIGSTNYSKNQEVFRKYLGEDIAFSSRSDSCSTYELSDKSELTIGSFSTFLRETFSRNNKILCCNYTEFKQLSLNYPEEILIENEGYNEFKNKVMNALNITNDEYFNRHGNLIPYYNKYNDDKPAHVAINEIIRNLMVSK